ncbi:hypothetical protein H696_05342 [Fonticula alba]|uniref:Cell cycle control protein 50A n=1 Tax=Fonticula alba TaxID=691883 RepID=A0A058Z1G1_FONAL|nr:hypothetical protein H696_05342 [Fonticula alba]KCV68090.1 hypothetical protein H696_05342 [Fonticula alba]|eukprot:XP_009497464.1 hypothetical protein H696_05342 [Fonticula alba]
MKYDVANNKCSVLFEVEKDLTGPVYLYYRLSNFYQNHRRYVKSFDTRQLLGKAIDANSLVSDCDPLRTGVRDSDQAVLPIYPCGLIANSFFNDTFSSLSSTSPTAPLTYPWSDKGIAWPSDLNKFRPTEYGPNDVLPPPNWSKYAGGYTQIPALWEDERFLVWMRTAGLPTFRKLWGRSDDDLPAGVYEMVIEDFYPVRSFNGTKSVVISTTSWIGGRNPFLGIAYLAVGSICILVGIIFLIRHVIRPRALGDTAHLSWNKNK